MAMADVVSTVAPSPSVRRYAVLGAGFAGVSVAWHLLQFTNAGSSVCVELYDKCGIGSGASGASGGLLHPYSPTGKLLWRGAEAFQSSLELLAVAEQVDSTISWRRGILRLALSEKHARMLKKNVVNSKLITATQAKTLLPGLSLPEDVMALHISEGINLDPKRYLEALWSACNIFANVAAAKGCTGTKVSLRTETVSCLSDLPGDYDGVIICLGAGAETLRELKGKLPLSYCRGVSGVMKLGDDRSEQFGENAPSIISQAWLAFQGQRRLLIGATKEWLEGESGCGRQELSGIEELLRKARQLYPGIDEWEVCSLRVGVRAMPPRTALGALPLAGCVDDGVVLQLDTSRPPRHWLLAGLGSRGLIYHAWLGRQVARAAVLQQENLLPQELTKWKTMSSGLSRSM